MRRGTATVTTVAAVAALAGAWRVGTASGQPAAVAGVHVVAAPSPSATSHSRSSSTRTSSRSTTSSSRTKTSTKTTAPAGPQQYTGAVVSTPYGNVQVAAVVQGHRLVDVKALHLTDANGTSRSISADAAPQLRQEALSAQSAHIDTVSGATYTSEGYRQSLQAALDAAHL